MSNDEDDGIKYELRIEHDEDADNPADRGGSWTVYSFCTSHMNFKHPDEFRTKTGKWKSGLQQKFKAGLAFILEYYEHGQGMWYITGTKYVPDREWDNVAVAGLIIWEHPASHMGAKTYADRQKDCEALLEEYNNWCNGVCYYFAIEDLETGETETHGGFLDEKWLCQAIRDEAPKDMIEQNTRITGDCAWAVDDDDIFSKPVKESTNAASA